MRAIASTPVVAFRAPRAGRDQRATQVPRTVRTPTRNTRCCAGDDGASSQLVPTRQNDDDDHSTSLSRRGALRLCATAAVAALSLSTPNDARAAYETPLGGSAQSGSSAGPANTNTSQQPSPDLSLYKRSFRDRFETSISSGTHDYQFAFPKLTWKPDIVSLNDGKLYGVDLRFSNPSEGKVCTHVLPFIGEDSLKDVGTPEVALERFVELIGAFWNENGFGVPGGNAGTLVDTSVVTKDKVVYYKYETKGPRNLIAAAVTDGQLYIINASAANERQWGTGEANLRAIVDSFYVPP
jgi:hypothetical protein